MQYLFFLKDPAIRLTSYAKMEGVLVHPVCATITMTVETTVMNLDAVRQFLCIPHRIDAARTDFFQHYVILATNCLNTLITLHVSSCI